MMGFKENLSNNSVFSQNENFLENHDEGERTGKRPYYDEICERLRKQRGDNS